MNCANCANANVTCTCKECGGVLLCDSCFDEIHKLKIFSSHAKGPLSDSLDDTKSPATLGKEAKELRGYISFLEAFAIEKLTDFKVDADVTVQKICETLGSIHAALYDFESKMRE